MTGSAYALSLSLNVDGFEVIKGDFVVMDWTNLSVPAADFWAAMKTGNVDTVGALVFAGDDKFDIVGSINGAPAPTYNGYGGNDIFHLMLESLLQIDR